jgi:hypothetical protein
MADPVCVQARHLEEQLRRHLEALLCRPSLLAEPQLLRDTAAVLGAAAPAAEALQALAGDGVGGAAVEEPAEAFPAHTLQLIAHTVPRPTPARVLA